MPWTKLGNGCDKTFYAESTTLGYGAYGAICCSADVAQRELGAYAKLSQLGLSVLPDIKIWPPTESLGVKGETRTPQYKIQRLALGKTFKPIMCALEVPPAVIKELKRGQKTSMKKGLEEIQKKLAAICNIVGELTLAVDSLTAGVFLLDFSPGQSGHTANDQSKQIGKGLANIISEVDKLPSSSSA